MRTLTRTSPKTAALLDNKVSIKVKERDPYSYTEFEAVVNGKTYTGQAKVFNNGSQYGIDGGRVSKLSVRYQGQEVANYDRGWDYRNCPLAVLHDIVHNLEELVRMEVI